MKLSPNAPCPCESGRCYGACCMPGASTRRDDWWTPGDPRSIPLLPADPITIQEARMATVWEADILSNPTVAPGEPGPAGAEGGSGATGPKSLRPARLTVTAGPWLLCAHPVACPPREIQPLAQLIRDAVRRVAERLGRIPMELHVRHADMARELGHSLARHGTLIVRRRILPRVDAYGQELLARATSLMGLPGTASPQVWAGWELDDDEFRDFLTALGTLYEASPWRHLREEDVLGAQIHGGPSWYLTFPDPSEVGPMVVAFREFPDVIHSLASIGAGTIPHGLLDRHYSIDFGRSTRLPSPMVRELAAVASPFDGPAAWPRMESTNSPGGGVRRSDIADLLQIFRALAARLTAPGSEPDHPVRFTPLGELVETQLAAFEAGGGFPLSPMVLHGC